jgi:D5-like protein
VAHHRLCCQDGGDAVSQDVIRLGDLDTGFRFDPADPVASVRAAEAADPGDRVARTAAAVRAMAAAGVMDAVTEATIKDYVTRNKLLGGGAFDGIVREATAAARGEPRRSKPWKTAPAPSTGDPLPDEPDSELGYARRLVHVYGDRVRYVPEWKWWLIRDGRRWARDATGQASRWMKSIARRVTCDALAIEEEKERQAALNRARRGESSAGVSGALTLAGTEAEVVVTPDDLDADPFLLNCTNGTLDLRTGELRPHDPADLITKMTNAAYDPGAAGAEFRAFLAVADQPRVRQEVHLSRQLLAGTGTRP